MNIRKRVLIIVSVLCGFVHVSFANNWWNHQLYFTTNEVVAVSNIVSESAAVMEAKAIFLAHYNKPRYDTWNYVLSSDYIPGKPSRHTKYTKEQLKEIDSAFGSVGVRCRYWTLPSCFTNEVLHGENVEMRNLALKYHEVNWYRVKTFELEEVCCIFNQEMSKFSFAVFFKTWQKKVINAYLIEVKRYLHKNGKSFLTKNGVNPLQPYMDNLVAALNAPMLNGINDCFKAIDRTDCNLDLSKLPSKDEVNKMVNEISIFTSPFPTDARLKLKLLIGLGSEEYNNFVRQYNG